MIRKALGLFAVAGGIALMACSSSDDASSKYPNVSSFCSSLAAAECNKSAGTCGVKLADCETAREAVCTQTSNAALAQGRIYTSANVEACLTATATAYDNPSVQADLDARDEACARVFAGTKTKSQVCTNKYDCSGTLVCDLQKDPTSGFCADQTTKQLNDGCGDPGSICATGLYCSIEPAQDFCRADRTLGQGCSATIPCVDTAYCNGTVCVALGQTGDTCTDDKQCATTFCNSSGKCATRLYPSETNSCKDFGGS